MRYLELSLISPLDFIGIFKKKHNIGEKRYIYICIAIKIGVPCDMEAANAYYLAWGHRLN